MTSHCSQTALMLSISTIIFKEMSLLLTWQPYLLSMEPQRQQNFQRLGWRNKSCKIGEIKAGNKFQEVPQDWTEVSSSGRSRNLNMIFTGKKIISYPWAWLECENEECMAGSPKISFSSLVLSKWATTLVPETTAWKAPLQDEKEWELQKLRVHWL